MQKDFKLLVEAKNGDFTTDIEGRSDDLLTAVTYAACKICAEMGKTPEAREEVRQKIVKTLNEIGPEIIECLAKEEEDDNATE